MRMNVLGMFKREDYFRIFIVLIFILSGFTILIRTAYADDTVLYADFPGSGIWKWDSTWSQVTPNNPQFMAAADLLLYGNFGTGNGIWKWDGTTWSQVTPSTPTTMVASGSALYGSFGAGAGIWKWDGSNWSQITPNSPTDMVASGSILYGNFGIGAGIWKWESDTWSQVTPNAPTDMVASGSILYGNFGAGAGIWKWDASVWSQITQNVPTKIAASGSLLYGVFSPGGIWKWDGVTWSQVTPNAPTAIAAIDLLLYGNFGTGAGIWKWDGSSWSQVTPNAPTSMTGGNSTNTTPGDSPVASSTLYFNPASLTVSSSQDFTISAMINPNTNQVSAAELYITFDPTKFRLDNITPSSSFSTALASISIDNSKGTAFVSQSSPLGITEDATSTIATLSFHALAPVANSSIDFNTSSIVVAHGVQGNVNDSVIPLSMTVNP